MRWRFRVVERFIVSEDLWTQHIPELIVCPCLQEVNYSSRGLRFGLYGPSHTSDKAINNELCNFNLSATAV